MRASTRWAPRSPRDRRQRLTNDGPGDDNKYQNDSPVTDVASAAYHLVTFRHDLAKIHAAWAAQLREKGFTPCSLVVPLLNIESVVPCTLQHVRRNDTADGPAVVDVTLPDWVTLSVDKPLGFPNGRILDEQVNDAVLAMGFLDMGGDCARPRGGEPGSRTEPVRPRGARLAPRWYAIELAHSSPSERTPRT